MKRKIFMVCIVAIAISSFVMAEVTQTKSEKEKDTTNSKVRWEYMVYPSTGRLTFNIEQGNNSTTSEDFVKILNKLGSEGWEVIQVGTYVILKRMIPPSTDKE